MRVSFKWLGEFIPLEDISPLEVAENLTMAGLEVEDVFVWGEGVSGIVAVQVLKVSPHPSADKLHLVLVSDGKNDYEVVCGDLSVKKGEICAFAPPGATVKGGQEIKKRKIRGVASNGMLCSGEELGVEEESEGILRLDGVAPGTDVVELLELGDSILELSVTPNRGDVLSHLGVARELSAIFSRNIHLPELNFHTHSIPLKKRVHIENSYYCKRYMGAVVEGVKIAPSPWKMRARLMKMGLRPINNVVDITNYVLLEMGQPLHAFDFHNLNGDIYVRFAEKGEKILLLDGTARELSDEDLLIADESGPVALAGVMGGELSSVSDSTVDLFLESACFDPVTIRRTGRRFGIVTESSYRFERGVDIEGVEKGLHRALHLLEKFAGGKISSHIVDEYPAPHEKRFVSISLEKVEKYTGVKFTKDEVLDILGRLNFEITKSGTDTFTVSPPTYRLDVGIDADVIEELLRIKGYSSVPETMPHVHTGAFSLPMRYKITSRLRVHMVSLGFFETVSYPFSGAHSPEMHYLFSTEKAPFPVALDNPMSSEEPYLRLNLAGSLLRVLERNYRKGHRNIRLFEVGKVFINDGTVLVEEEHLAFVSGGVFPELTWHRGRWNPDYYTARGLCESLLLIAGCRLNDFKVKRSSSHRLFHPGKSAELLSSSGKVIAVFGEIHPEVLQNMEIDIPVIAGEVSLEEIIALSGESGRAFEVPRYPPVIRDLSVVVDEDADVEEIMSTIQSNPAVWSLTLYDVYTGESIPEGKMSLTFQIWFRSLEKTLSSDEISGILNNIIRKLESRFGAKLR